MAYKDQGTERQRFRSFAERYLIARAPFFDKTREEEDAWDCMLKCRAIFKRLDAYSVSFDEREVEDQKDVIVASTPPSSLPHMQSIMAHRLNAISQAVRNGDISQTQAKALLASVKAGGKLP